MLARPGVLLCVSNLPFRLPESRKHSASLLQREASGATEASLGRKEENVSVSLPQVGQ